MSFAEQLLQILVGTIAGSYLFVIGHIVSGVGERRIKARVKPYSIAAQVPDIIQTVDNSSQITDPIGIGVLKALGLDFVKDRIVQPGWHRSGLLHFY